MRAVISTGEEEGRIERGVEVAKILEDRGHRVVFVGRAGGREAELVPQAGLRFRPLPDERSIWDRLRSAWRALGVFGSEDPDVIAAIGTRGIRGVDLAAAIHRIPVIRFRDEEAREIADRVAPPVESPIPSTGDPTIPSGPSGGDWPPAWRRVHVIGLGGAAMSALARVLTQSGRVVSGSDIRGSAVLDELRGLGVEVQVGHAPGQVGSADAVIVSAAIPDDNPEMTEARRRGIPVLSRGEAQALVLAGRRLIAVTGTHGKTTTSAMVATILEEAGADPTYLLGADLRRRGPGARLGGGDLAVVEADEAYGAFLSLSPAIALLTSVDVDHLDHYGDEENLRAAFRRFLDSAGEKVVVFADDPGTASLAPEGAVTYGLSGDADVSARDIEMRAWRTTFRFVSRGEVLGDASLNVPGRHNLLNALGAAAACLEAGIESQKVLEGLGAFEGTPRRFEPKGAFRGAQVVDGYAHLPREIVADLDTARQSWPRVVAVFQPHRYSRTSLLARDLGAALAGADIVVVTDVYAAEEAPIPGVSGKTIVDAVAEASPGKRVAYLPRLDQVRAYLLPIVRDGDVVLTLGAGDVTTLSEELAGGDG